MHDSKQENPARDDSDAPDENSTADETLSDYDKELADSFPASDPPAQP